MTHWREPDSPNGANRTQLTTPVCWLSVARYSTLGSGSCSFAGGAVGADLACDEDEAAGAPGWEGLAGRERAGAPRWGRGVTSQSCARAGEGA